MNWLAKKIGVPQPQAPQYQQPQNPNFPVGIGLPQPPPAQYRQPQAPYVQPQVVQQPPVNPDGTVNVIDAVAAWQGDSLRGGARETAETGNCPACGSVRFFSRKVQGGILPPSPHCFDCGYPSDQGIVGHPVKEQGPVQSARQNNLGSWGENPDGAILSVPGYLN